eukprot:COSAG04_NODE_2215_length_4516_cov_6.905139_1_plen_38_part_10
MLRAGAALRRHARLAPAVSRSCATVVLGDRETGRQWVI